MRSVDDVEDGIWKCLRCSEPVRKVIRFEGNSQGSETSDDHSDFSFNSSEFGAGSYSNMSGSMHYSDSEVSEA